MGRRIESLMIPGPAGRLEALLEEPEEGAPKRAILVCHPHPQHGGTMHNKVVYRIARGLRKSGAVVLRFNYRGVNLSEGEYANSVGEQADAEACLAVLRERYPELPYAIAGFSFGSRIALRMGKEPGPERIIAVGFPTVYKDRSFLEAPYATERIFVHSTNDEFGPRRDLENVVADLTGQVELYFVEAKDHFFTDNLDGFEKIIETL